LIRKLEQVRKRGLPPLIGNWQSGGKPLFLTVLINELNFPFIFCA